MRNLKAVLGDLLVDRCLDLILVCLCDLDLGLLLEVLLLRTLILLFLRLLPRKPDSFQKFNALSSSALIILTSFLLSHLLVLSIVHKKFMSVSRFLMLCDTVLTVEDLQFHLLLRGDLHGGVISERGFCLNFILNDVEAFGYHFLQHFEIWVVQLLLTLLKMRHLAS